MSECVLVAGELQHQRLPGFFCSQRVWHKEVCGRADVLKMTIWQTPAGIVDEGGMILPAWLNFGLSLEAPPENGVMHVSNLSSTSCHVSHGTTLRTKACEHLLTRRTSCQRSTDVAAEFELKVR